MQEPSLRSLNEANITSGLSPSKGITIRMILINFIYVAAFRDLSLLGTPVTTTCQEGLGMENGQIQDAKITASSEWADNHGATNARLNRPAQSGTTGGWSAQVNDASQWIQADLGGVKSVTGVKIQGRNAYDQWVTKFKVQYSNDGNSWTFVENGKVSSVDNLKRKLKKKCKRC